MAGTPAMFLDRDGVVIEEVHYLSKLEQIRLIPGAAAAIRKLNATGVPVVVATNQSGVARGYFPESFVADSHDYLAELLAREEARIDRFYYCPHHREKGIGTYRIDCACRKPHPGMLLTAARDLNLDLSLSWLVGDKLSDCAAGTAAGCRTILVRTGHGRAVELPADIGTIPIEKVAADLPEAIQFWETTMRRL